ncbi:MAG: alternative ribosome rescue aminoacyl-tRNA hydrolase ArfB [Flavipsychrobacter sp.]|nr:alternative ribosome rescue aminoacyl-tRNA hydrolase ArfB [Flavipsychrobacter sp.]
MRDFSTEIFFKTARSGGKGGQNVNKVETMVEAWWDLNNSRILLPEEKEWLHDKLKNRITKDGYLFVKSSETRSQLENKDLARARIIDLVTTALIKPKKRKASKPSKAAIAKRLDSKHINSLKKTQRRIKGDI